MADLLGVLGIVAEAALVSLLFWRRTSRSFPVFFAYMTWGLLSDSFVMALRLRGSPHNLRAWVIETIIDTLFQYGVLIELAWSILRPIQRSLPKGYLTAISTLIAAAAIVVWPFSTIKEIQPLPKELIFILQFQSAFAVLRILFFMVLAGTSQLLRLSWRDRELQIATGLGFYSLVSLGGSMLHAHEVFGSQFYNVDLAVGCSYLLSLVYWIVSFAQQEAPRQEMTEQMQRILIGVADTMHGHLERLASGNFGKAAPSD